MDLFYIDVVLHWFDYTFELFQRFSVLVVVAFTLIRREWLRQVLVEARVKWYQRLIAIVVFSSIAMIGTLSSIVIDLHELGETSTYVSDFPDKLTSSEALIGFRDTIVMMAGLIAGPWVGLGTGLIAGIHRYNLGGVAAFANSAASALLGFFAGAAQVFFPHKTATTQGVLYVAFLGSLLQRGIVLLTVATDSFNDAYIMSLEIAIPTLAINCVGCVLFYWIMYDFDRERLQNQTREALLIAETARIEAKAAHFNANFYKQRSEISALHAQVEPHFINNTLTAIQALIAVNPENARTYIAKLATFFNETRESASLTSITVEQELMQVQHYMEFQQLRFQEKVLFEIAVPTSLFEYELPPRSLHTLVENALTHSRRGLTKPLTITIHGTENTDSVVLSVADNGCGIASERLALLGKQIVTSSSNGTALYQLNQSLLLGFAGQATLSIQSVPQQGTTITIRFPKEQALC